MKKYTILLLIFSMCGGTADTDLDSFEEVSLKAKEVMSDAQEESQNEYVCKNSGKSNLSTHQRSFCRNVFFSFPFLARSILKPHSFTIRYVVR